MPQVDLETLVSACAGGSCDRKIACETLATTDAQTDHPPGQPDSIPPDFPPDSFYLSKDDEFDWFDRNAFYERKDSQKGNSNSTNLNPNVNPTCVSTSQRFALKTKASIIGLPKPQKACYADAKNRRNSKPAITQLFPKRSGSAGKCDSSVLVEPSSPKVSCMGRVRSKRDRNRRLKNRQKPERSEESRKGKDKSISRRKPGLLASLRSIFRSGSKDQTARDRNSRQLDYPSARKIDTITTPDIRRRLPPGDAQSISAESISPPRKSGNARKSFESEPAGLGGMKRFVSGRRSDSWADIDAVGS
ncbi:uncharacterized protein LOC110822905 [Carica papaya]|uniref:uncharacterized protein LOC110822905 n=1 Tax=Carica papaya TaxID=3649 RepID=UPI000B8C7EDC|nr:uncharacterized protein LOC110822905 [Carica papaya]